MSSSPILNDRCTCVACSGDVYCYLDRCKNAAEAVIRTQKVSQAIFSNNCDCFGFKISSFSSEHEVQNITFSAKDWAITILSLGIIFLIGTDIRGFWTATSRLNETTRIQTINCSNQNSKEMRDILTSLAKVQGEVDQKIKTKALNYLGSSLMIAGGGIFTFLNLFTALSFFPVFTFLLFSTGIALRAVNFFYFKVENANFLSSYSTVADKARELNPFFVVKKEKLSLRRR
jgi:hypothetical protein